MKALRKWATSPLVLLMATAAKANANDMVANMTLADMRRGWTAAALAQSSWSSIT